MIQGESTIQNLILGRGSSLVDCVVGLSAFPEQHDLETGFPLRDAGLFPASKIRFPTKESGPLELAGPEFGRDVPEARSRLGKRELHKTAPDRFAKQWAGTGKIR